MLRADAKPTSRRRTDLIESSSLWTRLRSDSARQFAEFKTRHDATLKKFPNYSELRDGVAEPDDGQRRSAGSAANEGRHSPETALTS